MGRAEALRPLNMATVVTHEGWLLCLDSAYDPRNGPRLGAEATPSRIVVEPSSANGLQLGVRMYQKVCLLGLLLQDTTVQGIIEGATRCPTHLAVIPDQAVDIHAAGAAPLDLVPDRHALPAEAPLRGGSISGSQGSRRCLRQAAWMEAHYSPEWRHVHVRQGLSREIEHGCPDASTDGQQI